MKKKLKGHEARTVAAVQKIVRAVIDYSDEHEGQSPTTRQLAEQLGYADHTGPIKILDTAERLGLLKLVRDVRIVVKPKGRRLAKAPDPE
jgi:Mn-dependent DtxR family transcriptional regulator